MLSLVSWRQSIDESHPNLYVVLSSDVANTKYNVVAHKNKLTVTSTTNPSKVQEFTLYETVKPEVEVECTSDEIHITLTKSFPESWKSLFRTPVEETNPLFLSAAQLDTILQTEVKPFRETSKIITEEDADKLLDELLATEDNSSMTSPTLESEEYNIILQEISVIRKFIQDVEKQLAATQDEGQQKTCQQQIRNAKVMIECCERIAVIRKMVPVTVSNILEVVRLDLVKNKVRAGFDAEEQEEYEEGEEGMSEDMLYSLGMKSMQQHKIEEALHYLRLAALRKGHTESTMQLVRIYHEIEHETVSMQLILTKAMADSDPFPNFTCAQMFDNGVSAFLPSTALALYFYQRAAAQGEPSAMCFMSKIFERGGCQVSNPKSSHQDIKKSAGWLQLAVERGSLLSYKIMLEHYLEAGEYAQAKKYHAFLYDTSRELLKSVENVEARLDQLRRPTTSGSLSTTGGPTLVSRAPPTSTSAHADNTVATRSNAEQRLQKFEDRSGGRVAQGVARSSREASSGERSRKAWERRTKLFVVAGAVYLLAFPLRVLALPTVAGLLEGLTGSFSQRQSKPKGLF